MCLCHRVGMCQMFHGITSFCSAWGHCGVHISTWIGGLLKRSHLVGFSPRCCLDSLMMECVARVLCMCIVICAIWYCSYVVQDAHVVCGWSVSDVSFGWSSVWCSECEVSVQSCHRIVLFLDPCDLWPLVFWFLNVYGRWELFWHNQWRFSVHCFVVFVACL